MTTSRRADDDAGHCTAITPGNSGIDQFHSPPTSGTWEREEIARIIDPKAWAWVDRMWRPGTQPKTAWVAVLDSLTKADAIMALAVGGEVFSSRAVTDSKPNTETEAAS